MLMKLSPTSEVTHSRVRAPSVHQVLGFRLTPKRWLRVVHYFQTCLAVARQRQQLLELDDRMLEDIGISRIDARREASRHFWDIPEHQKNHR